MIIISNYINNICFIGFKRGQIVIQNKKYYSIFIYKQYNLKHKLNNINKIIKRFAGSGKKAGDILGKAFIKPRSHNRTGSTLLPSSNPNVRSYSNYAVVDPDPLNTDAKAKENNPLVGKKSIQHPEINRKVCDVQGCKDKICVHKPCSTVIEDQSIGHATHGTPKISYGEVVSGGPTDLNATDKTQNFVIYKEPHNTSQVQKNSKEKQPATTILNNDPTMLPIIKKHEK